MLVLGFLGSPMANGTCSKLLKKALQGAKSKGAKTKRYDLINCTIQHCQGCFKCMFEHPELPIGKCPIKDDIPSILETYIKADGYIFASPVYEMFVTSLMKKFLERKIALGYRSKDAYAKIGDSRRPANFKKMASFIVTANATDEFHEAMGGPCFEAMESHLFIEQVPTVDRLYVGGVENMSDKVFSDRLNKAYKMGIQLVEDIEKAQMEN